MVNVELERTHTMITGRVRAGDEAEPVVGFIVEHEDGSVHPPHTIACHSDGTFSLFTDATSGWLAAAAQDHAPKGQRHTFSSFQNLDVGTIALGAGAWIEGVAYSAGGTDPTAGRVHANNVAAIDATRVSFGRRTLALVGDGVASTSAESATGPLGEFRISGLTAGDYDVIFVPTTSSSGFFDEHEHGTTVTAPISGIELESPIRTYTLRVSSNGAPVSDATVKYQLAGGGSVAGPTTPQGEYEFFMSGADDRHQVTVSKPGFAPFEQHLGPQDFGQDQLLEIDLESTGPVSNLTLEFQCKGPLGPLWLRMALEDSAWYVYRELPNGQRSVDLGDVPPGRYRLSVMPKSVQGLAPGKQSSWFKTDIEIECTPNASATKRIELRSGGRVAIHLSGMESHGAGKWELIGTDAPTRLALLTWDPLQSVANTLSTPGDIRDDGIYWLRRQLTPGEFRLEIAREGEATRSHRFTVAAGEVIDVFVDFK